MPIDFFLSNDYSASSYCSFTIFKNRSNRKDGAMAATPSDQVVPTTLKNGDKVRLNDKAENVSPYLELDFCMFGAGHIVNIADGLADVELKKIVKVHVSKLVKA
jgi:hypothetical protein